MKTLEVSGTSHGQVENAEVRKRKYGNGSTEVRRKVADTAIGAWFTNVPCRQRVTVSKRCES